MSLLDPAIGVPGATLTGLILVEVVILVILGALGKLYVPLKKTVIFVLIGLFASSLFRFIWWILKMTVPRGAADHVMNRLSWLLFTIAFLLLLFGWIEAVHSKFPPPTDRFVPVLKWVLIALSVFISVFVIVFLIVWGATANGQNEGNAIYEVNILFLACVQAIMSIGFLVYGFALLIRVWRAKKQGLSLEDARHAARYRTALVKIVVTMSVLAACFLVRFIFLLYRPATGRFLPNPVFHAFAYIIPDTLPALVEMFIIISTSESRRKQMLQESSRSGARTTSGSSSSRSSGSRFKGFASRGKESMANVSDEPLLSDEEGIERPSLGVIFADEPNDNNRDSQATATTMHMMNYEGMGSATETQEVPVMDYSNMGASAIVEDSYMPPSKGFRKK